MVGRVTDINISSVPQELSQLKRGKSHEGGGGEDGNVGRREEIEDYRKRERQEERDSES